MSTTGRIVNWPPVGRTNGAKEDTYKDTHKTLKLIIHQSKKKCFTELYTKADVNPRGSAYRVVMG